MLIVLEGADGVGKSTLAADLADRLGANLLHFGPPEEHPLAEYQLPLDAYRPGLGRHVVVDRLHWSQEVYGPLHRGECQLGVEGMRHMDLYLLSRGAFFVHLTDWPTRIEERMLARGDQGLGDPPPEDLRHLVASYWHLAERSVLPHATWRFGEVDPDDVLRAATEVEHGVLELNRFPNYVGGPHPRVLLVGDQLAGSNRRSARHLAAFTPYPECSGAYLLRTLSQQDAETVGLVNAFDCDVPDLLPLLNDPPVVALGRSALDRLEEQGVKVAGVAPHPQYWRRFHHWKPALYAQLLEDAVVGRRVFSWPIEYKDEA